MQVTRESHWLREQGIQLAWEGATVDPTEPALPGVLPGSEATPFSTLVYAVGWARWSLVSSGLSCRPMVLESGLA